MATELLQRIVNKERSIPETVRPAIQGGVARISRNYKEITSSGKSREFFYKECRTGGIQRTFIQRMFALYMAVTLSSKASAAMFDAEFADWQALRDGTASIPMVVTPSDIWDKSDECSALLAKVNRHWGNFDIPATRTNLVRLRATVDAMLRSVNQMPDMTISNG